MNDEQSGHRNPSIGEDSQNDSDIKHGCLLRPESSDGINLGIRNQDWIRNASNAYISVFSVITNDDILMHMEYIYECDGYHLFIRDYKYPRQKSLQQLASALLGCNSHEYIDM